MQGGVFDCRAHKKEGGHGSRPLPLSAASLAAGRTVPSVAPVAIIMREECRAPTALTLRDMSKSGHCDELSDPWAALSRIGTGIGGGVNSVGCGWGDSPPYGPGQGKLGPLGASKAGPCQPSGRWRQKRTLLLAVRRGRHGIPRLAYLTVQTVLLSRLAAPVIIRITLSEDYVILGSDRNYPDQDLTGISLHECLC